MNNILRTLSILATVGIFASPYAGATEVTVTMSGPVRTDIPIDSRFNGYFQHGDRIVFTVQYRTDNVTDSNPSESQANYYDSIRNAALVVYSNTGAVKYSASATAGRVDVTNGIPECSILTNPDAWQDPACEHDPQLDFINFWMNAPAEGGGDATGGPAISNMHLQAFFSEMGDHSSTALDSTLIPARFSRTRLPSGQVQLLFRDQLTSTHGPFINTIDFEVSFAARKLACQGFEEPVSSDKALRIRKERVLPLRIEVLDENIPLTNSDIEPPVLQVIYEPYTSGSPVSIEALQYVGLGDLGNRFVYQGPRWAFNLLASDWAAGTYRLSVLNGAEDYELDPTCAATIVVD